MQATLLHHGVSRTGMVAAHARDIVREQARDDALVRGFVSILSVGLGIAAAEGYLDSALLELEYALHIADSGAAKPGSTIYLGVSAGERVPLTPGGPWVELPMPDGMAVGVLKDIDVLYLTKAGEVQLVEVKRSGQALWEQLEKTKGRYTQKFATWRDAGEKLGQRRGAAVTIRFPNDGYLDRPLTTEPRRTPRQILDDSQIAVLETPGRQR